jgi:p-hydroxybenzoate 3-monooxygenase
VAIIGAGPAGLLLGRMLGLAGIDTVVLEARTRRYVEDRIRAGTLEQPTIELLAEVGLDEGMRREGAVHEGFELRFDGRRHRIDTAELTDGRVTVVYGQQELVKDAIAARLADSGTLEFDVSDVALAAIDSQSPAVEYRQGGQQRTVSCDFIAGCDGFHGASRPAIPAATLRTFQASYPFAWLGILAEVAPSTKELIYAAHERGFALHSMRSPSLSRFYLQVDAQESLENWDDQRIWAELRTRLGETQDWRLADGPIINRGITPMRSFVCEPMQYGSLFLAGDAAHIVPPTAAKGLNLAVADARLLAECLIAHYHDRDSGPLERYSQVALERVWWAQEFSREMTWLMHHEPGDTWAGQLRSARLARLCGSKTAARSFSEQYVGLPFTRARSVPAAA